MQIIFSKVVEYADVEVLWKLSRQTFIEAFAHQNSAEDMDIYVNTSLAKERLDEEWKNVDSEFYFLKNEKSEIMGYFKINYNDAQNEKLGNDHLELERIYIIKEYQNLGLGTKILDFIIEKSKAWKISKLWLGVWEENHHAIRFYERNGFEKFSEHFFYLGKDKQLDVLMKKHI
jgi:diamine N-acetyltransferase